MKRYLLLLIAVVFLQTVFSQPANYEQYAKQIIKKAENLGNEIGRDLQRTSQFAMRANNRDIYVLYMDGKKMACFSDEFSCKSQINSIKTRMRSLMESAMSGLPRDVSRAECQKFINNYINSLNFSYRKEHNPNYQATLSGNAGTASNQPFGENSISVTPFSAPEPRTTIFDAQPQTSQQNAQEEVIADNSSSIRILTSNEPQKEDGIRFRNTPTVTTRGQEDYPDLPYYNAGDSLKKYSSIKQSVNPFSIEALEQRKKYLEEERKELYRNCVYFNPKSDCTQFQPIDNEIDALNQQIKGRKEWKEKVENMSQETLKTQEKQYQKLADMAGLSDCTYSNTGTTIPNFENITSQPGFGTILTDANMRLLQDKDGKGFHCDLFKSEDGKYILSFRGTEPTDINDLLECAKGNFYKSPQTKLAIQTTEKIINELEKQGIPRDKFELTGHSLGGRLAAEAAIANNLTAYTFNAADISQETKNEIGVNSDKTKNIINTVSANDFLTASSFGLGSSEGGVNSGTVRNIKQDGLKDRVEVSNYTAGYTNVIGEAYGTKIISKNVSLEAHSITFLRQSLEQRHNDIINVWNSR